MPVLGLPLLFDQMDNLVRLEARGAAHKLDTAMLTAGGFLEALLDILETPSYRLNMRKLSRLHRDRPMHPLDKAAFWVEYVMRHKGAPHLCTEAYSMLMYSYYSWDVAAVLLSVPPLALGGLLLLLRALICRRDLKTGSRNETQKEKPKVLKGQSHVLKDLVIAKASGGKKKA